MLKNDTKLMESVIALAEDLHFGRAARRLRISQPMLTKTSKMSKPSSAALCFSVTANTLSLAMRAAPMCNRRGFHFSMANELSNLRER